jgi:large subunit ribosomal protein L31
MKANIHPTWHQDTKVTCSCGNSFVTGSTKDAIVVDICSDCHPFFTGEMKFVDVQGRVEKFQAKMAKAKEYQSTSKTKKTAKTRQETKSLKDMLTAVKEDLSSTKK